MAVKSVYFDLEDHEPGLTLFNILTFIKQT